MSTVLGIPDPDNGGTSSFEMLVIIYQLT